MAKIEITAKNSAFWAMALKARRKELAEHINDAGVLSDVEYLRSVTDELCKVCAYIEEVEKLHD